MFRSLATLALVPATAIASAAAAQAPAADRFLMLDKIELPLVSGASISGHVTLKLAIRADDPDAMSLVRQHIALLRAGLIARLATFDASDVSGLAPVDVERLSSALNARPSLVAARYRILVVNVHTDFG